VIEFAKVHTIDTADLQVLESLNQERVSQLAKKHQLSLQEIKAGYSAETSSVPMTS